MGFGNRMLFIVSAWAGLSAFGQMQAIEGVKFEVPGGWELHQQAHSEGTAFVGLARGEDYLRFYVADRGEWNARQFFAKNSTVLEEKLDVLHGPLKWDFLDAQYASAGGNSRTYIRGFFTEFNGKHYYGYASSSSRDQAVSMVTTFVSGLLVRPIGTGRSLTGTNYGGKKYYVGFGEYLSGFMGNEVKYDIQHTHNIFTDQVGGSYLGERLLGPGVGGREIRRKWEELRSRMTADDMYVQYSSGHGSHSGLMVGVSYDEIRDNALSYPAKEIIIFTMACYSGNLVSSFDRKKEVWRDWGEQGRTLMVMASSKPSETSATGPIKDPEEPGGPSGSAGSAFGHALWKALIGHADGFVDGVRDGFVSLGEIRDFAIWKTRRIGGHTPVVTGVYHPGLVMNRVPSRAFLREVERGSEGLSEAEIMRQVRELDEAFRVNSGTL